MNRAFSLTLVLTVVFGAAVSAPLKAETVQAVPASASEPLSVESRRFTVFMGSAFHLAEATKDVQKSLAAGNITLYLHGDSVNPVVTSQAQKAAIQAVWGKRGTRFLTGGGAGIAELGCCQTDPSAARNYGGRIPGLATMNLPKEEGGDGAMMTDANEADLEKKLAAVVAYPGGPRNIAPFMRPDPARPDRVWDQDAFYAPYRKLALYTGAVAIDMPSTLAMSQSAAALDNYANEIAWGIRHHLRVTLLVSPFVLGKGGCTFDHDYLQNTRAFVTYLLSKAPPPTEYAAEDYCGTQISSVNTVRGDSSPNSTNQVVLYLSTLPVSPAGTALPHMPGGSSEETVIRTERFYSPLRTADQPEQRASSGASSSERALSDINTILDNSVSRLQDMAYQSSTKVNIQGGNLNGNNTPLNIYLTPESSFLSQTHLTFSGPSANVQIVASANDATLQIFNPYNRNPSGITLGNSKDPDALKIIQGNGQVLLNHPGFIFSGPGEEVISIHSPAGYVALGRAQDGALVVSNSISQQDDATAIELSSPGMTAAQRPRLSTSNDGGTLSVRAPKTIFSGNISSSSLKGAGNAYACLSSAGQLYRSETPCR